MRPLRLTMRAFGPYAGTETVDFDGLTDLGLFVVAGGNGSGKTTIFDALHYSLFGTLPGRRASYIRLKSDHADESVECRVTFEFAARGKLWRVERTPKQTRAKRRGSGVIEVDRSATLGRLDAGIDGPATTVSNKIGDVDARCRDLVGLTGRQFERVALLPQGEFSRVLQESGSERRELLRTLFSSEVFGDATDLLAEQAAEATTSDRAQIERLDLQLAAVAEELTGLIGHPVSAATDMVTAAIVDVRANQVAAATERLVALERNATAARQSHERALDLSKRRERRDQVQADLADHERGCEQYDLDLARLQRARAAIPVAANVRALEQHRQHLDAARERRGALVRRVVELLEHTGIDVDHERRPGPTAADDLTTERAADLAQLLTQRAEQLGNYRAAVHRIADCESLVNGVQGELRRATNDTTALGRRHDIATAKRRQLSAELATLADSDGVEHCERELRSVASRLERRRELAAVETAHDRFLRQTRQIDDQLVVLERRHEKALEAQAALVELEQKADAAVADYEESMRRHRAALDFRAATERLALERRRAASARRTHDGLWDAFIAGTAARIAEALVDCEPCPVCGSADHPNPARPAGASEPVSEVDLESARVEVEASQVELRRIEVEIERLRSIDEDIAALDAVQIQAEASTLKAMALGARTIADEARSVAAGLASARAEISERTGERASLDGEMRALDQRRNHLEGALGDSVHQTVAMLEAEHEAAERALVHARNALDRTDVLTADVTALDEELETIALRQLSVESRRASIADQLEVRQGELAQAVASHGRLVHELGDGANEVDLRLQAIRQSLMTLEEIRTAKALEADATVAVRRATAIVADRLAESSFDSADAALDASLEPQIIDQLEAQTAAYATGLERLRGQLVELADLDDAPCDLDGLAAASERARREFTEANRALITMTAKLDRLEAEIERINAERAANSTNDAQTRRLERVAALVKGDNDRNTSLENWVLAAHLRNVVELANLRLARSTHQRFQLCVLDDADTRRGRWGLDLGVEDTVTGTRRPTAGLSGGELFQASLALALGLADAVMNQSSGVRIDALFIDEGFGSLDETSVERAIDLLDELRDQGALVGVITHVPALLAALPVGVRVTEAPDGSGSTIHQRPLAA